MNLGAEIKKIVRQIANLFFRRRERKEAYAKERMQIYEELLSRLRDLSFLIRRPYELEKVGVKKYKEFEKWLNDNCSKYLHQDPLIDKLDKLLPTLRIYMPNPRLKNFNLNRLVRRFERLEENLANKLNEIKRFLLGKETL